MDNTALKALEPLIGKWEVTMHNAWFLDSMETKATGWATFDWLHDSFVVWRWKVGETPAATWVIGFSDPQDKYEMFYYDERGMSRIFAMEFDGKTWTFSREDKDFYQRFEAHISKNTIKAVTEASEDQGKTWRKDFDLIFTKK
jgi:hypothetical protein